MRIKKLMRIYLISYNFSKNLIRLLLKVIQLFKVIVSELVFYNKLFIENIYWHNYEKITVLFSNSK